MPDRDVALFDALATALTATEVETALEGALREIARVLDLTAAWIWLVDAETGRFYLAAAHGLPPYLRAPVQMTGDPCWCIESFLDGDFDAKNVDIIACSRLRKGAFEGQVALTGGIQAHASVALRFGERRLGIMNVCPPIPRKLSEDDLRLLSVAGAQIGLAVERGRLAEVGASAARTAERTRLAREIHDTLAQDLTAIALYLEAAQRDLAPESPAAHELGTALGVARSALAQARVSVLSLRADPLAGRPLSAALAALARRITSETGIRVTLHVQGVVALPYEVEGELFRIASEALQNARLHARASRIEIDLQGVPTAVSLRVRDDGAGFDVDAAASDDAHYGLVGMKERAHLIGADFIVTSAPNAGTTVEIAVPKAAP